MCTSSAVHCNTVSERTSEPPPMIPNVGENYPRMNCKLVCLADGDCENAKERKLRMDWSGRHKLRYDHVRTQVMILGPQRYALTCDDNNNATKPHSPTIPGHPRASRCRAWKWNQGHKFAARDCLRNNCARVCRVCKLGLPIYTKNM